MDQNHRSLLRSNTWYYWPPNVSSGQNRQKRQSEGVRFC